uniref:hepatic and glial cell adhesion molecule-like isoform X2 n=1 Tax=Pristiophorus japonicus TaxID=55135 RepID=UPI00398E7D82
MVTLTLTAGAVCLLISAVELQGLTVQTENSRINVTVGDNAFFSVLPSVPTISITWNFGTALIGQWTTGTPIINDKYRTRVEYFPQNGSLLLMSLTVSDSGEYTVTVLTGDGSQAKATITLHVLVELQGLTIQTENSRINVTVGDNAFFSVLPSVPTIIITWNFGTTLIGQWAIGIPIINDKYRTRVEYYPQNGSLLLMSVTVSDSGEYTVTVLTGDGSQAKATITLHVLDQTSRDNNMSSGAIAGIVIAAILTVGLISGISAWSVKRKAGGMSGQAQGQNDANISSPVNVNSVTIGETSAGTYENIPRKQKERATEPLDENSTYMGLQLQDQSVYSDLMRR